MDTEIRIQFLEHLSPNGWNLLAELFDKGATTNLAARTAVEVEDFLIDLIQDEKFAVALRKQQHERTQLRKPIEIDAKNQNGKASGKRNRKAARA